jgi:hypothetical protein
VEGLIGPADYLHERHKAAAQLKAFISSHVRSLPSIRAWFCQASAYAHAHMIDAQLVDIGGGV